MATTLTMPVVLQARAAALHALHRSGLDVSELVRLDVRAVCDLEAAGRYGYHVTLASGTRRPIPASAYSALIDYLCRVGRLGEPDAPLFPSRQRNRLSTKQARRILASVAARAGMGQAF